MRRKRLLTFIIVLSLSASGCGLIPKEEVLPEAPVIPTYELQEYKKVSVMRGDVIDSVKVHCTYKAYRTEWLRFNITGVNIDHVYVEEGDLVKAGDVLADLEMGELAREIQNEVDNIELLELQLTQEEEAEQLAISNQKALKNTPGYTNEINLVYEDKIITHESTINELKDELYIEKMRLEQAYEEKKNYQLIAGIDGVVSNVTAYYEGDLSDKASTFISLYDPDTMIFTTDGSNSELFELGKEFTIQMDQEEAYQTVVVNPEELLTGEELESQDPENPIVYLQVKDAVNTLESGKQGFVEFIIEDRRNVLYLPAKAIYEENGKSVVYVEDKDGFKSVKEIETGLAADQKVEIISGLKEGDSVILD